MTNDFETKLADAIWALVEPKIDQKLAQFRDEIGSDDSFGMTDDHLDNQIEKWMRYHFDLSDYHFDITEHSHEIDGMIDAQLEYQATNGDLKDWLGENSNDTLRETIKDVLGDITIKMDVV